MGIVKYSPGIDYVKGSLAKPKKRDGHKCGDYLIGTHREAATTNSDCTRLYIRKEDAYERSTSPGANELRGVPRAEGSCRRQKDPPRVLLEGMWRRVRCRARQLSRKRGFSYERPLFCFIKERVWYTCYARTHAEHAHMRA